MRSRNSGIFSLSLSLHKSHYVSLIPFCVLTSLLLFRYVSFDPLGNLLLTGISNTFGTSAFVSGASSSLSSGPSTLGGPAQVPNPIPYRLERNEQERERNLQSRYQVSGFFAAHHLTFKLLFSLQFSRHYWTSTKDYEFGIRNYAIALQNWNLTPPVLVRVPPLDR